MFYHLACSEFDEGADYLEELMQARDPDVIWVGVSVPQCLQSPRVGALLEKIFRLDLPHSPLSDA